MPDNPITPTRVIPAGAPLPARPPGPDEIPPWRSAPPAPPPPPVPPAAPLRPLWPDPPAPAPIEVRVSFTPASPVPEPSRWERFTSWLGTYVRPWQAVSALALAVIPIPWTGYSTGTTWAYTVSLARDEFGQGAAYALALTPLMTAVWRITRSGGTLLRLLLLAVSVIGLVGAMHWYDPVTWITGVTP
ncbi:hypothetical protein [Streptomyces chryseus]